MSIERVYRELSEQEIRAAVMEIQHLKRYGEWQNQPKMLDILVNKVMDILLLSHGTALILHMSLVANEVMRRFIDLTSEDEG